MIKLLGNLVVLNLLLLSSISSSSSSSSSRFVRGKIIEALTVEEMQLIEQVVGIGKEEEEEEREVEMVCRSWRVAAEANNLNPWKKVPEDCAGYLMEYMRDTGYEFDLRRVADEAKIFAADFNVSRDGKDVWIFDVDETLISNIPYYSTHGYGLELFDHVKFDEWVEKGKAPSLESSLKFYQHVLELGFKVVLLTGRSERHRNITVDNLVRAGFGNWDKLILRASGDHRKTATAYKSEKRDDLVAQGYRIVGNWGDQWSDLLGSSMSLRSFKLPNPMYYIP